MENVERKVGQQQIQQPDRRNLAVLETYIRLRDGVAPTSNAAHRREALKAYNLSFSNVREANIAIAWRGTSQCRRFTELYDKVGGQLSQYYDELLRDPPPSLQRQKMLVARVRILQFFERTLFGMILAQAEGGQSALDPSLRNSCAPGERGAWANLLLKGHQDLERLSDVTLGDPSSMAMPDEAQDLRVSARSCENVMMAQRAGWVIGEIALSILLWEKGMNPLLRKFVNTAKITPLGRLIQFSAGTLYIVAWVAFDRQMRDILPFLGPTPDLLNRETLSSWERILGLGEEFVISSVSSPPLYFAYVELLGLMRKESAYEFLTQNEEFLKSAEAEFGSIEKAIEKLKEVLRHEDLKPNNSSPAPGNRRERSAG